MVCNYTRLAAPTADLLLQNQCPSLTGGCKKNKLVLTALVFGLNVITNRSTQLLLGKLLAKTRHEGGWR